MELEQLVLSKYLLSEAKAIFFRPNAIAHGIAISLAHDAAEIALRAICKQHDVSVADKDGFEQTIGKIDAKLSAYMGVVPLKASLQDLNKLRVNFKHYGLAPEKAASQRAMAYAESFLETAFSQ